MTDTKQLTSEFICHGNEAAIRAARLLGVPLARVQKLIMSRAWQAEQKEKVVEKVKRLEKGKSK